MKKMAENASPIKKKKKKYQCVLVILHLKNRVWKMFIWLSVVNTITNTNLWKRKKKKQLSEYKPFFIYFQKQKTNWQNNKTLQIKWSQELDVAWNMKKYYLPARNEPTEADMNKAAREGQPQQYNSPQLKAYQSSITVIHFTYFYVGSCNTEMENKDKNHICWGLSNKSFIFIYWFSS